VATEVALLDRHAAIRGDKPLQGEAPDDVATGSGEEATFSPTQLSSLVALAQGGLKEITALQASFLAKRLL